MMNDTSSIEARPLPLLRAMLDTLDRDLLQLLVQRTTIVREIAQYKRAHRVQIRDLERERFVLDDRTAYASELGLSPGVTESIFRLILWDSRDRQAALRVEVPCGIEPKTVAIVGGQGQMGACLARLFSDLGHHVLAADLDTPTTPRQAAEVADVVVISVPIDLTVDVIRDLGPRVRPDALLMDVTSTKRAPVEAMLSSSRASVVGTHPMFGPSVHSLQGQLILLCPARGEEWANWARQMFHARGLVLTETTPEQHDRMMAVVQVLLHFSTEAMGRTLTGLGLSLEEMLQYTSPPYLLELMMTARHFAQDPDLYAAIEMNNPEADAVTSAFAQAVAELRQIVLTKDRTGFEQMFNDVQAFMGDFTASALEQSSFLVDRLVERS